MVWLDQLMRIEGHDRAGVTAVIISTVVPRALHNLQLLAHKYFGVDALVAGREPVTWGIALKVDERSEEHTSELQSLMRTSYAVVCLANKTDKKQLSHKSYNEHSTH